MKLCKDMEEKIYSLQTESRKYEMELDAAVREKVRGNDRHFTGGEIKGKGEGKQRSYYRRER